MVDRKFQGDGTAGAVTENVSAVDAETVEQADDVAGVARWGELPIDVRRAAVTLHLHADHLVALGQHRNERGEVQVDGQHASVQEHQRRARPVGLVVEVYPVDVGVAGVVGVRSRSVHAVSLPVYTEFAA